MRTSLTVIVICLLTINAAFAQTTIVLRPDAANGNDAMTHSLNSNQNYGNHSDFAAIAGSNSGVTVFVRSFIEFDLSSVPSGSVINDARLSLYAHNSPGNGTHSTLNGPNTTTLSRIISTWTENTITWNNQPAVTTVNEVTLAASTMGLQHYPDINVTNLVQDMSDNPNTSYGFMLKLVTESKYRKMLFASSDHADTSLHPKLVITYSPGAPPVNSDSCFVLKPGSAMGQDAFIHSLNSNTNYANHRDWIAVAGTNSGVDIFTRGYIDFDLSRIPSGAVIDDARLSLYSYNSTANATHSTLDGPNTTILTRVITPWSENTVTWNNQPADTSHNAVTLPASTSSIQHYTNIDVTDLIQDMRDNPTTSYGLMLKLVTESKYRKMVFASSDNADPNLHPKLEVCYSLNTSSVPEFALQGNINIYPNPSATDIHVSYKGISQLTGLDIFTLDGKRVYHKDTYENSVLIDVSGLVPGLYVINATTAHGTTNHKFMVE